MILGKISKFDAISQILRLKYTKFDFRWDSALDTAERAYSAPPDELAVFKGPTSKGRDGQEEGRGRGEKGKGDERGRREERKEAGPQTFWPRTAPIWIGSSADERCQNPSGSGLSSRFD